jgi:hypothetical protein
LEYPCVFFHSYSVHYSDGSSGMIDSKHQHIHIYPNPSSDYIYIELTKGIKPYRLFLTDMNGRKHMDIPISVKTNSILSLNVADFLPGIYSITIRRENGMDIQETLIINN